jgi:hypothetical protein
MQIQQRQHLLDLRGLARPPRQDRRTEPLPLTGFRIHAAVIDPRCVHSDRPRRRGHLARRVIAVAHHEATPMLIAQLSVAGDVSIDLSPQCLSQHPPSTLADDLIDHRRRPRRTITINRIRNYS